MNLFASRSWIPLVGSFAVYLVPLAGPHAAWFLGESLFQELTRGGARNAWWLAADLATALAAQISVGLTLAWSLRGSRLRLLAWIPIVPALMAGLNMAYLVAIPSYVLIEPDTAPEVGDWEEHCSVPDVALMAVRTPAKQPVAGVREWWVQRPDARYALLRLPGCEVVDSGLPTPTVQPGGRVDFMLGFQFAVSGGAASLERVVPSSSERSWWLLDGPSALLEPITPPDLVEGAPILSDNADAVAWVQRVADSGPPVLERVLVRPRQSSQGLGGLAIELAPFGPASYTLLGVDTTAREAILWRNDRPLVVGFDGERRDTSFTPGPVRPQASTHLRYRDGWVAWDAYRDEGPYQIAWSLATGSGTHRTKSGRSFTSVAVDPTGTLVAMSESTTLNIGSARDAVYVVRARDGADVFRVYLPRYARSQVVFFAGGLFAYSEAGGTRVLRIRETPGTR